MLSEVLVEIKQDSGFPTKTTHTFIMREAPKTGEPGRVVEAKEVGEGYKTQVIKIFSSPSPKVL